jgi:hypothetical protein
MPLAKEHQISVGQFVANCLGIFGGVFAILFAVLAPSGIFRTEDRIQSIESHVGLQWQEKKATWRHVPIKQYPSGEQK